jgi:hypothetical protein
MLAALRERFELTETSALVASRGVAA